MKDGGKFNESELVAIVLLERRLELARNEAEPDVVDHVPKLKRLPRKLLAEDWLEPALDIELWLESSVFELILGMLLLQMVLLQVLKTQLTVVVIEL